MQRCIKQLGARRRASRRGNYEGTPLGVITLFLIVGMDNDAQAACDAACRANCRATTHQYGGLTYEECVAIALQPRPSPADAPHSGTASLRRDRDIPTGTARHGRWRGFCFGHLIGGHCYGPAVP
jgi:hypothetical protein